MFRKMIPRDETFFDMFDRIADNIVTGVQILKKMVDEQNMSYCQELKTIEHQTDELVHTTVQHLHRTFVTPLDREDIRRLANRLDDILDLAHVAGSSIEYYKPRQYHGELNEIVNVLLESAKLVREMVGLLRDMKKNAKRILELTVEINRLENVADVLKRSIMARLFEQEKDPIELIKWKDILAFVESATDRCEDVGDVIEGIVLENS